MKRKIVNWETGLRIYPEEEEEIEITKKRLSDAKNKMRRSTVCLTGISKENGQGVTER